MVLVFVLIWVKSVLRCSLYIFHLSDIEQDFANSIFNVLTRLTIDVLIDVDVFLLVVGEVFATFQLRRGKMI